MHYPKNAFHNATYEGYPESNIRFGIKKNPIERKHFLLYTFESHNLKLFFNTVAVLIEALIITVHKLTNSIVIKFCRLRLQPLIHACLQFRVVVEALRCEPGLHVWKHDMKNSYLFRHQCLITRELLKQ